MDIPSQIFLLLREHFFDEAGKPNIFKLRDKLNTQDDPLDEYIHNLIKNKLALKCEKASPLVSPDLVVYQNEFASKINKRVCDDVSIIVGIEVKKLSRTSSGDIARKSGLDYNTTPPCGKIRIFRRNGAPLDIHGYYLFVCQEVISTSNNEYSISALALCDGNALNMDFNLYLSAIETREKLIGLGTYSNGLNRQRPMFVFSNPLGLDQMDNNATMIHIETDLHERFPELSKVYNLNRTASDGIVNFSCYRHIKDIKTPSVILTLSDFPTPKKRKKETQSRGKMRISI